MDPLNQPTVESLQKENEDLVAKLILAEERLEKQLVENENLKAELEAAQGVIAEAAPAEFEYDGKKYEVIMPKVFIPGIGERTALEVCVDEDAQTYLVKSNTIGSVLKEL